MDLRICADTFEKLDVVQDNTNIEKTEYIFKNIDDVQFIREIMLDKNLKKFLEQDFMKKIFAHMIGVEGLITYFNKTEVCDKLSWDFIREYFLDHIKIDDILDFIGWETVSKHFSDYLHFEKESKEDINNIDSILEKLNGCEGTH